MRDAEFDDAMRRRGGQIGALHVHAAAHRADQAGDDAHQRGLAGAVGADDRNGLAGVHLERDVEQCLEAAIAGVDRAKLQHRTSFPRKRESRHGAAMCSVG